MRLGGNIRSSFGEWRAIIARPETARSLSRRQATVPPRLSREAGGSSLLQSWSRPQCRGPLGGACSAAIARPIRIHTSCPSWSPRPSLRSACRAASISASAPHCRISRFAARQTSRSEMPRDFGMPSPAQPRTSACGTDTALHAKRASPRPPPDPADRVPDPLRPGVASAQRGAGRLRFWGMAHRSSRQ
jgi:hypothetical protein